MSLAEHLIAVTFASTVISCCAGSKGGRKREEERYLGSSKQPPCTALMAVIQFLLGFIQPLNLGNADHFCRFQKVKGTCNQRQSCYAFPSFPPALCNSLFTFVLQVPICIASEAGPGTGKANM